MKWIVLCFLLLGFTATALAMNVPEATRQGILNDCRVTAELSVMLLKMKAKSHPEQLYQSAQKILKEKGYQGSFGELEYIAGMYTGSALQMGPDADQAMASASSEDLQTMGYEHEMMCLEKAMTEFTSNNTTRPPQSK